jgi:peptidylprolyl isomerase
MKRVLLAALLASAAAVAVAQAPTKPASTPAAKHVAHPAAPVASGIKLPPGVPAVRGILKTAFSLKYQDVKVGAGVVAEPNKVYQVHYTGWLAADGRKFDSSHDHPASPVIDSTGKPVMGADSKPKQEAGQPIRFIQGVGRVIPGWDQGFEGMKIGGKRRLFIPWQLAYGARGRPTNDPKNPGIPAKADLIFDVELLDVTDMPMPPSRPPMGGMPGGHPLPGSPGGPPAGATAPVHLGQPAAPTTLGQPPAAGAPATPAAPANANPSATPANSPAATPTTPPATTQTTPPASSTPAAPSTTPQPK